MMRLSILLLVELGLIGASHACSDGGGDGLRNATQWSRRLNTCVNLKDNCEHQAKFGHCVTNARYMADTCPLACGLCVLGSGAVTNHWIFVANTPKTGTGTLQVT